MSMSSTSTITNISSAHKTSHLNHTTSHRISNGAQACAACKYQRRKCAPDCILAPYFPHDRQPQFLNAHKLFGVSNITKIIRDLSPQQKDTAMQTIIFQSDMRAKDPVGGCYGMIQFLQHQIECRRAEMEFCLQQIAMWRAHQTAAYQQQQQIQISVDHDHDGKNHNDDPTTSSYEILHDHQNYQAMPAQDNKEYVNVQQIKQQLHENHDDGGGEVLNHHPLQHHVQDFQYSWSLQDSVWIPVKEEGSTAEGDHDPSREVRSQTDHSVNLGHEFVEITSFDRGDSFKFDPEQAIDKRIELEIGDRCGEMMLKSEMMLKAEDLALEDEAAAFQQHQIQEHDLRGAATLFTLTS